MAKDPPNWLKIHAAWIHGASTRTISLTHGIRRQTLIDHIHREGWTRTAGLSIPAKAVPVDPPTPPPQEPAPLAVVGPDPDPMRDVHQLAAGLARHPGRALALGRFVDAMLARCSAQSGSLGLQDAVCLANLVTQVTRLERDVAGLKSGQASVEDAAFSVDESLILSIYRLPTTAEYQALVDAGFWSDHQRLVAAGMLAEALALRAEAAEPVTGTDPRPRG
jgi:hypothetical protein